MVLLAAATSKMINELHILARLIANMGIAILNIHGISTDALRLTRNSDDKRDDAHDSDTLSSHATSDEDELAAEPDEPAAAATGTDSANGSEDERASSKDFTTFWETRPTRDMSKQLSTQEIDSHKTDLNVATLEVWKLKALTFMRRRHPQFGALLQLVWTDDDNETALEIVTDNEYGAAANVWGASALLALIDTTKPKGTVFEHDCSNSSVKCRAPLRPASTSLRASHPCSRRGTRAMRKLTSRSSSPPST